MSTEIPEAAMEAAALALYERDKALIVPWADTTLPDVRAYLDEARTALGAAAPSIRAQVLEEMAAAILTNDPLDFWAMHLPEGLGFQEAMSRWLKAYALAEMSQTPDDFPTAL